jgi:hypothetical protein
VNGAERLRLALVAALLGCAWFAVMALVVFGCSGDLGEIVRNAHLYLPVLVLFAPSSVICAFLFRGLWRRELDLWLRLLGAFGLAYVRAALAGLLFLLVIASIEGASLESLSFEAVFLFFWPWFVALAVDSIPGVLFVSLVMLFLAALESRAYAWMQPTSSPRARAVARRGFRELG